MTDDGLSQYRNYTRQVSWEQTQGSMLNWEFNSSLPSLKRLGKIEISMELLLDLLKIPKDAGAIQMFVSSDGRIINITFKSEYLNEVLEGAVIPTVTIEEIMGFDK